MLLLRNSCMKISDFHFTQNAALSSSNKVTYFAARSISVECGMKFSVFLTVFLRLSWYMADIAISLHLSGPVNHVALWQRAKEFTKQGAEGSSHTPQAGALLLGRLAGMHAFTSTRSQTASSSSRLSQSPPWLCSRGAAHTVHASTMVYSSMYFTINWIQLRCLKATCAQSISTSYTSYLSNLPSSFLYRPWKPVSFSFFSASTLLSGKGTSTNVLYLNSSAFMRAISTFNAGTKASGDAPVGKQKEADKWREMPCGLSFLQPFFCAIKTDKWRGRT